ncbi:MAG TPA: MFS transporter [Coleofasciculaceae cyanobacterium]
MTAVPVSEAILPEAIAPTNQPVVSSVASIASTFEPVPLDKAGIRRSLKASTLDSIFSTIFSNITSGVLVTNFLLELKASPTEIGILAAIPMLANLVQPLGAHFSERTTSRYVYNLWSNGIARLLWCILAIGIGYSAWRKVDPQFLVALTLVIALSSGLLAGLSSASWVSWMVILVPRRLRGRYFSIRNSAAHLANLIFVPLTGWMVARWIGGPIQGFGVVLMLGAISGMASLLCQSFMVDVNPQKAHPVQPAKALCISPPEPEALPEANIPVKVPFFRTLFGRLQLDNNALLFLIFFSLWMFGINLSAPFYSFYLLDHLQLDISKVTLYSSLTAGANLLLLVGWGRLADRFGNRVILLGSGAVVSVIPLLWLMTDSGSLSVWLWLPLLHMLIGGTWAAIDLCLNNLQIGIAPLRNQAAYFGTTAAITGVTSALGTLCGGFLVQVWSSEGLIRLFILSSLIRLLSLTPLLFVREPRSDRPPPEQMVNVP